MTTTVAPRIRLRSFVWADPAETSRQIATMTGKEWLQGIKDGAVAPPPAASLVGLAVERVEEDEIVFALTPAEYHYNPAGTVHGGILTTLADTAMTTAVIAKLPPRSWAPTIELKINFVRPVTEATGRIYAIGRAIHVGSTTAIAEARIVDEDGRLLAHATTTAAVRQRSS